MDTFGLGLVSISFQNRKYEIMMRARRYWIASGMGSLGVNHAVVYYGEKMVHDPSSYGNGVSPSTCLYFVLLDPALRR